ncbi:ferredoxin--NADP reductase [Chitinophaga nivalis]|uniref:Ferredoxin--NADP reductase n=1 Tax=Chitinophaga nivalis TaxID=2991709 RepID=A0ABT3IQ67_9BACT|nr:ferredoxin--NADP reductase [Chitinophaga nivalis]MCW3464191.1 ferredoxin--NADP reductase [Chitinophaga nivalis]MCW3486119.1 ferredoxin--NADP reductase [Chitinophaga nivalis]
MTQTYNWRTADIIRETNDTVTIVFDTQGIPFHYDPGQFINVTIPVNGVPVTRSYTISSLPDAGESPAITVKKVDGGLMSSFIVDKAAAVHTWEVDGPYGAFVLPPDAHTIQHLVLLAGGSGITPLYVLARAFVHRFPAAAITLIYSSRNADAIIFKQRLEDWAAQHPDQVHIHHALSRASATANNSNVTFSNGRINKLIAKRWITRIPATDTRYFICGPAALMQQHQDMLTTWDVPAQHLHLEWFAPDETPTTKELPTAMQEVLLHLYEQSNLIEVQGGQTILAAALEDRIPLPYSCRNGTCGRCAAKVTSGVVTMERNYALGENELAEGWVLLCQSYPVSSDVTVEIE